MATTHALAGLLLGAVALVVAPDHAPAAMLAGFAGGLFPDLDLLGAHRRTLHFPIYYTVAGVVALAVAVVVPTTGTVTVAVFLLAAGLHAATDALGGGLELRPWRGTSEKAVYSHYHDRWLRPRRWIPYDGSPADLALASLLALAALLLADVSYVAPLVTVTVAVSAGYTVVRKRLVEAGDELLALVPASVEPYVPDSLRP